MRVTRMELNYITKNALNIGAGGMGAARQLWLR